MSLSAITSHNFFHQRDNWRMHIFDLLLASSQDWRISHALSHHVFPNTIYDYEISAFEPHLNLLPTKRVSTHLSIMLTSFLFFFAFFFEWFSKWFFTLKGERKVGVGDFFPFIQLLLMSFLSSSLQSGLW